MSRGTDQKPGLTPAKPVLLTDLHEHKAARVFEQA
jgi:hypothetical protein